MGLLKSVVVIAIVIAVIAMGIFYVQRNFLTSHVTKQEAVSLILADLQNNNPGIMVNVTNESPSQFSGSWHVEMSVVYEPTSVCPRFYAYSFDYPKYGFVYTVENNYTSDCIINGFSGSSYIIASGPVAVVRAYNLNVPEVMDFLAKQGSSNVMTNATFYSSFQNANATFSNVWVIRYTAPNTTNSVFVALSQIGGNLLANFTG